MSETYSVLRTWLTPILMDFLSKNTNIEYPQKIFEQGLVTVRKENKILDHERIAYMTANNNANYTEAKQAMTAMLKALGINDYTIEEAEQGCYISGRVGRIVINGVKLGWIGEIHPQVLENWQIQTPVACFEINLNELFDAVNKKL